MSMTPSVRLCSPLPTSLRDALDLAYLEGQRAADVLKLAWADIKDGALWIEQNKTGKKFRISIEGDGYPDRQHQSAQGHRPDADYAGGSRDKTTFAEQATFCGKSEA